ncbi:MAG: hypothetical protein JWN65_4207 [Solirubrobacterales bacterium]|nr:hypothetical protein [Solirubrobacterales bacterium]
MDPLTYVDDLYLMYEEAIELLSDIAETTTNPSAKVGAIKAAVLVQSEEIALLQAVGILPHNLGSLAVQLDVQHVAEAVIAVFEEFGVSEEAQEKIMRVLRVNRRATSHDAAMQ